MSKKKVMVIFGTRPEAIKMAPVIKAIQQDSSLSLVLVVTAQHRQMLDEVLGVFNILPDHDLNVMSPNQSLEDLTSKILRGLSPILEAERPEMVLVHGDTTTAFAAALAAFYKKIPVAHVEAGLRTRDKLSPWPEEMNRRLVGGIASLHFAPTEWARNNLSAEGVNDDRIAVTGNTVIDALKFVSSALQNGGLCPDSATQELINDNLPTRILVTGHRRENFGAGFTEVCNALKILAQRRGVQIIYPVHPNPNVSEIVFEQLENVPSIKLIAPQNYVSFVYLMTQSTLILTDSGGIQEEAPSLKKPVLVMRDTSERPEAIKAGTAKLVGAKTESIVKSVNELLNDEQLLEKMRKVQNPYGDGCAAGRILVSLKAFLAGTARL